jgi:predicted phosphodiesterase
MFQIASDIHLEFLSKEVSDEELLKLIVPKAPILCLVGDVWNFNNTNYQRFFKLYSGKFRHILFVAGNHEYYNGSGQGGSCLDKSQIDLYIDRMFDKTNVTYLNRRSIVIEGVRFIGATLWSQIPDDKSDVVTRTMNDYKCIYEAKQPITTGYVNHQHRLDLEFITREILMGIKLGQRNVVLTHHTPVNEATSAPQFRDSPTNCAFSTDLRHLICDRTVAVWVCGHTHFNFDFKVDGTRVVSNQRGYRQSPSYQCDKVISLTETPCLAGAGARS